MSYYVRRTNPVTGKHGWVGPIRSYRQARREFAAWEESGWSAMIFDSTPDVRATVRHWQRAADNRLNRTR